MDQSWFSKDYGVLFTFLLRMLNIANCINFCNLCGTLFLEILLIEFLGTLLFPILKVNEGNDRCGKVRIEIFEVTSLKRTLFLSNQGCVCVCSFCCHLREMKLNRWNRRGRRKKQIAIKKLRLLRGIKGISRNWILEMVSEDKSGRNSQGEMMLHTIKKPPKNPTKPPTKNLPPGD